MAVNDKFIAYIDQHADKFIQCLSDAAGIKGISGDANYRKETIAMGHWLDKELKGLGVTTSLRYLGKQTLQGQVIDLPPVILGRLGDDPKKKTVLMYGHYDV